MASLRKHKGHYNARFYDKNRSPQRKEVSLGTTRKSVAEPKLRRIEDAYARGDYDPWRGGWLIENKPLAEAGENFIESKKQAGLRPNTVSVYYYVLEGLKEHTPPGIMTRDVSADHVRSYIHAPKEEEGKKKPVSNATKRHRHSHLRTFFRWAIERGWIDENPVEEVKKPRKEQKKKAFLQKKDLEKLLASIDAHRKLRQGEPGPTPNDEWLKQMIVVAVITGMRRGELLNLRWVDVDLEGKKLLVRNRDNFRAKNGQERFVHLVGNALDVLRRMYEVRDPLLDDPVFIDDRGKPPRPDRVSKRFKFYVRKAKLKNREDLHFHSLRHTTASWLTMKNYSKKVVADVLGHTTTRMADMYSHLAPGITEQAMEQTFGGE